MKRRQVHPTHLHHFRKWRSPCSARTRAPDQTSCSTIRALSARWASAHHSAGLCISMLKRNFCLLYKTILLFTLEEHVNAANRIIKGLQALWKDDITSFVLALYLNLRTGRFSFSRSDAHIAYIIIRTWRLNAVWFTETIRENSLNYQVTGLC